MRQLKNFRSGGGERNDAESNIRDSMAKYSGMDENGLMRELMKNVAAAKGNGSFSAEQLDEFVRFVSPNLDEQSRKRLNELVDMIKNGR